MELLTTLAQIILPLGITLWVYNVLNKVIVELRADIEALEKEVKKLKESENRWYKKYHTLLSIMNRNGCKEDCPLRKDVVDFLSKEGETK